MLDAAGLMQWYCQESSAYRAMVMHAFERYPGRKLRLILYEDEIQPGNVFLLRRKLHAWYFSFREFDQFMRDDNAWICFAILQSSIVPKVRGQFSAVSKVLIQTLFTKPMRQFAFGIAREVPEPRLVMAELEDLQDADALKYKWAIKGHGGLRPCMHCIIFYEGAPSSFSAGGIR